MFMRASARSKLTTSLFSTTFIIAVLTVAGPQIIGCPAKPGQLDADAKRQQKLQQPSGKDLDTEVSTGWQGKSVVVIERRQD